MLTLPFESVDVVGTRIAAGTVGIVAIGDGEGAMMTLFDAGVAWLKTTGSRLFADTMTSGALYTDVTESSEGAGVVVGAIPASGVRK